VGGKGGVRVEGITREVAQKIVDAAVKTAQTDGGPPICVAVCDKSGFLAAFSRMDGAPIRSIKIAQAKAYTASRVGVTTAAFLERLMKEKIEASYFCDPDFTALPGGAPIISDDGTLLGGVGISGRTSENDQILADDLLVQLFNA
jgi:uncharacterized protein GlcG (DUF336 family)